MKPLLLYFSSATTLYILKRFSDTGEQGEGAPSAENIARTFVFKSGRSLNCLMIRLMTFRIAPKLQHPLCRP